MTTIVFLANNLDNVILIVKRKMIHFLKSFLRKEIIIKKVAHLVQLLVG